MEGPTAWRVKIEPTYYLKSQSQVRPPLSLLRAPSFADRIRETYLLRMKSSEPITPLNAALASRFRVIQGAS